MVGDLKRAAAGMVARMVPGLSSGPFAPQYRSGVAKSGKVQITPLQAAERSPTVAPPHLPAGESDISG